MGTEQRAGDTAGSQPTGPALAVLAQCWAGHLAPAARFFTFPEHCKTVLVLFREMPAVLSRLSGFFP